VLAVAGRAGVAHGRTWADAAVATSFVGVTPFVEWLVHARLLHTYWFGLTSAIADRPLGTAPGRDTTSRTSTRHRIQPVGACASQVSAKMSQSWTDRRVA
jgi:hypothetical protein